MIYYVYSLKSSLDDTIFYIGKGTGKRMYKHLSISMGNSLLNQKNKHLYNKIKKLYNEGGKIIYDKLYENDIEDNVLKKEMYYISELGTYHHVEGIKNGHLLNLTKGGEGTSGYKLSEETKKKMSEAKKR